jgi:hypothetical protein
VSEPASERRAHVQKETTLQGCPLGRSLCPLSVRLLVKSEIAQSHVPEGPLPGSKAQGRLSSCTNKRGVRTSKGYHIPRATHAPMSLSVWQRFEILGPGCLAQVQACDCACTALYELTNCQHRQHLHAMPAALLRANERSAPASTVGDCAPAQAQGTRTHKRKIACCMSAAGYKLAKIGADSSDASAGSAAAGDPSRRCCCGCCAGAGNGVWDAELRSLINWWRS